MKDQAHFFHIMGYGIQAIIQSYLPCGNAGKPN